MKQILISLFIISSVFFCGAQEAMPDSAAVVQNSIVEQTSTQPGSVAEEAQKDYEEGNFRKAIELLEAEIALQKENGKVSAQLYYNLGNAYFRVNEFPEAILNYERALLYDPGDRDIRHNIKYANTKIEDKILTADNFFLQIWFDGIQNLMTSNNWAVMSVVFFLLLMVCLSLFFFSSRLQLKKGGFYAGIILFFLLIFTNLFAVNQKRKIENRDTAIIMAGSAPVVSSPTSTSKELFILHAGTKVIINKSDGSWYEIEIADGSVGWIQKNMLEII